MLGDVVEEEVASPGLAPLLPPTLPGLVGVFTDNGDLTRAVHHRARGNRPGNTTIAYDPKLKEFKGYSDAMFSHQSVEVRYLVTPPKVYEFIFYQSHREKRKAGRLKRGESATDREGSFSLSNYQSVMGRYRGKPSTEWVPPTSPLQFQQVNTYKSSLIELHKEQVANNASTFVWNHHIWTCHCIELYKLVKACRNRTKKDNYVEKVDESFSFFKAQGKAGKIEDAIWLKASNRGLRAAYPAIR
jgi:hypothetical protein